MSKLKSILTAILLWFAVGGYAQKDVTSSYITNPNLSDGTNGWTVENFNAPLQGHQTVGYASECYAGWGALEKTSYSMKQTITLPAGNYRLVNYSFYRESEAYNSDASTSRAYLQAGENKVLIKTLGSVEAASYANSQAEGANCFDSKMYRNVLEFSVAADDTPVEIGIYGTFEVMRSWCIAGKFELFDMDEKANVDSPTDVTYAINNSGFEYRDLRGWTNDNGCIYQGSNALSSKSGMGFAEKWVTSSSSLGSAGDFHQTLTGLEPGLYEVSVYGQNLEQGNGDAGGKGMYVFANDSKTEISIHGQYKVRATIKEGDDLKIGIRLDNCSGNWISFDRFELKYYGDPIAAYQKLVENQIATAETFDVTGLHESYTTLLTTTVNKIKGEYQSYTEEAQFNAAVNEIQDAINTTNKFLNGLKAVNKLKEIYANTNVYTAEAYATINAYVEKFEAGTMTADEAQSLNGVIFGTGWRSTAAIDDFLISAWDAEPRAWDTYHVNTWSTTGDSGNPNFVAPCIEYWVGDADKLADKVMTATVAGLTPNAKYSVSILACIGVNTGENGVVPTGMELQVGEGTAVSLCTGERIAETRFYEGTFTAEGTADAEGNLVIKINVAGTNASWLTFRNVKYAEVAPEATGGTFNVEVDKSYLYGEQVTSVSGITMTFGYEIAADLAHEGQYADFKAGVADTNAEGWTASTAGNGANPKTDAGKSFSDGNMITNGTVYTFAPTADGKLTVGVVVNASKSTYVTEDAIALADYNGITYAEKYYGNIEFNVTAGKVYQVFCTGSKMGFYGFTFEPGSDDDVPTAIDGINKYVKDNAGDVYSINGVKVRKAGESLNGLAKGLYIINGKKLIVK